MEHQNNGGGNPRRFWRPTTPVLRKTEKAIKDEDKRVWLANQRGTPGAAKPGGSGFPEKTKKSGAQ